MKTTLAANTTFSPQNFALGLLAGFIVAVFWFMQTRDTPPAPAPVATATTTTTKPVQSGALEVADQQEGDSVVVESVTVPPPGVWVAVRETGLGDELGNVLGAARVHGPRTGVSIPLLRPIVTGREYAVELYRADSVGDFDPASTSVYVDFDTGARVVVLFHAL